MIMIPYWANRIKRKGNQIRMYDSTYSLHDDSWVESKTLSFRYDILSMKANEIHKLPKTVNYVIRYIAHDMDIVTKTGKHYKEYILECLLDPNKNIKPVSYRRQTKTPIVWNLCTPVLRPEFAVKFVTEV